METVQPVVLMGATFTATIDSTLQLQVLSSCLSWTSTKELGILIPI